MRKFKAKGNKLNEVTEHFDNLVTSDSRRLLVVFGPNVCRKCSKVRGGVEQDRAEKSK